MKYKSVKLIANDEHDDEFLCSVELNHGDEDGELAEELEDQIITLFEDDSAIWAEAVTETVVLVRFDCTFDVAGVERLKTIYDRLVAANLIDAKVFVSVHIEHGQFDDDANDEYNEDAVSWSEFIAHLEY